MIRRLRRWRRCKPAPVAAVLALLLSLRVVAPGVAAPPVEGYVPICTGDRIVYVALGDPTGTAEKKAPAEKTGPPSAPCPWAGLGHAALEAPLGAPPLIAPPAPLAPAFAAAAPLCAPATAFRPRAPPGLAS